MKKDIIKNFTEKFIHAPGMWEKLSEEFDSLKERDKEMFDSLEKLGDKIGFYNDTYEALMSTSGANIDEILGKANNVNKEKREGYAFMLFIIIKNLEHAGFVNIITFPKRVVKEAMATHAKKRK